MADIKKIMMTAAANIKAVFGVPKANIKKVGDSSIPAAADLLFREYVALISAPTFEYRFAAERGPGGGAGTGYMVNDGSLGSAYDGVEGGSLNPTPTLLLPGFEGYITVDAANDQMYHSALVKDDVLRSTDRSYIYVWTNETELPTGGGGATGYFTFEGGQGSNQCGAGGLTNSYWSVSGGKFFIVDNGSPFHPVPPNTGTPGGYLDAGAPFVSHSTGGTAVDLSGANGLLTVLVIAYKHHTNPQLATMTYRWKQSGTAASGHTLLTRVYSGLDGSPTETGAPTTVAYSFIGDFSGTNSTREIAWRYHAIIDATVSAAEFDTLAAAAGI